MRNIFIFLFLPLIIWSQKLSADTMSVGMYKKLVSGDEFQKRIVMLYVNGVLDGLGTANASLGYDHQDKIFCKPDSFVIDYNVAEGLADSALKSHHINPDVNVGAVILVSLKHAFPCK